MPEPATDIVLIILLEVTIGYASSGEGRVKYQVRIYVIFLLKTNSGVLNLNFSLGLSLILF